MYNYEVANAPHIIEGKVEITAQKWEPHGISSNAFAFMEDMRAVLDGIPAEFRATTEIDFRTWSDREGYPEGMVAMTYKRPPTPKEIALNDERDRSRVLSEGKWISSKIAALLAAASESGMKPTDIGIEVVDGKFVVDPEVLKEVEAHGY